MVSGVSWAAEDNPPAKTLITIVNIFDGVNDGLAEGMSVLIEGNHIAEVAEGMGAGGLADPDSPDGFSQPSTIIASYHASLRLKLLGFPEHWVSVAAVVVSNEFAR